MQRRLGIRGFRLGVILIAFHVTSLNEDLTQQPVEVAPAQTENLAPTQSDTSSQQNHHSIHSLEPCQQKTKFILLQNDARFRFRSAFDNWNCDQSHRVGYEGEVSEKHCRVVQDDKNAFQMFPAFLRVEHTLCRLHCLRRFPHPQLPKIIIARQVEWKSCIVRVFWYADDLVADMATLNINDNTSDFANKETAS